MAWHGVVTNAGAELIRSFTANNKLNIGSIQTGTGSVAIDQMRARTALVTQKAAKGLCGANIAKMEEVDGGIRLLIQVNSTSGAYVCKEIGVWGGLGDDSSSTLIMYIMSDGNGVSIPDSTDLPDYSFLIAAVLGVSNVSNVIVNIDTTVNATRQYVDEEAVKKVNIAQGTANNGKVMMVGADGNVTPTEYPTMTGATANAAGKKGAVPAPSVANRDKYLRGDGVWATPYTHPTQTAQTGIPTADQTPAFGGTFNVGQVASDANGHVTGITNRTVKIPNGVATQSAAGLMSAADKKKLDGVAEGANAYTHPSYTAKASGLYKVTVDATGHVSGATAAVKNDITALGIPGQDTTYSAATQSAAGLMSAADKKKLDGVATGANAYTHPAYTAKTSGLYKITVDGTGHVSGAAAVTKNDITALGIPAQDTNTTYSPATQSANGLMSAADKKKLDGIAENANAYSLPTASSSQKGGVKIGSGLSMSGDTLSASITPSVMTVTGYITGNEHSYAINNTGDRIYIGEFSVQLGINAEKIIGVHLTTQTEGLLIGEFTMVNSFARTIFVPYIAFSGRPSSQQFNISYL